MTTAGALAAAMEASGIDGYVVEAGGAFYIPIIAARWPGRGDCARWLDGLPRDATIKVPAVINPQLGGMLERRGFVVEREWAEEFQEWVEVHVRRPEGIAALSSGDVPDPGGPDDDPQHRPDDACV